MFTGDSKGLKERFPIFQNSPELIYLDSAATTHKPKEMIEALSSFYAKEYATVHRAIYRRSLKATDLYNATREAVQKFINAANLDEIVFTRGTTDALNLVASSYGKIHIQEGDEILITEMEHHANIVPWQLIAKEKKAVLSWIPVDERGVLLWEGKISHKTKIVALSHVSNVTGTVNPIREIATVAHKKGAVVVVDGAQSAPHMKVDVQALDCDFYAFSSHKCYGPTGVGVLYGKKHLLDSMPPRDGGGDMIQTVEMHQTSYQQPPLRFEAGTPIIAPVIAFKSSLDFIEEIGRENIAQMEGKLFSLTRDALKDIPGFKEIGTATDKAPILTFTIDGVHPLDVGSFLDFENIAIRTGHLCAQPILRRFGLESAMRVSFGVYNSEDDVDRFISALKRILDKFS